MDELPLGRDPLDVGARAGTLAQPRANARQPEVEQRVRQAPEEPRERADSLLPRQRGPITPHDVPPLDRQTPPLMSASPRSASRRRSCTSVSSSATRTTGVDPAE